MKTSAAMENLLLYLQSLPKSNRKWLSYKLIEGLHEEEETISKEEILAGIDRGLKRRQSWADTACGRVFNGAGQ